MATLILTAVLAADPAKNETYTSIEAASRMLADELETGALLFSRGDCLAVKVYTYSPYTHVAAVVCRDGRVTVYDATSGVGVRRHGLKEYLRLQQPNVFHVFRPRAPFSRRRAEAFEEVLQRELGRPYAVKHFLTGKRAEGVHCSEYVTDALIAARLIHAHRPARVSPASLAEGILESDVYSAGPVVRLETVPPEVPRGDNWCEQLWIDTKVCTRDCCTRLRRWFLCR